MILEKGKKYNVKEMLSRYLTWTDGDGSGSEGYSVDCYFDLDGTYLGADQYGIEPVFSD
jgi:hypothetical protein